MSERHGVEDMLGAYERREISRADVEFMVDYIRSLVKGNIRLEQDCQEVKAALRALVTDQEGKLPAGVAEYDGFQYCIYCDDGFDFRDIGHKPSCPIVAGRKALGASDG